MGTGKHESTDSRIGNLYGGCICTSFLLFVSDSETGKRIWSSSDQRRPDCKYWVKKWCGIGWGHSQTAFAEPLLSVGAWKNDSFVYLYQQPEPSGKTDESWSYRRGRLGRIMQSFEKRKSGLWREYRRTVPRRTLSDLTAQRAGTLFTERIFSDGTAKRYRTTDPERNPCKTFRLLLVQRTSGDGKDVASVWSGNEIVSASAGLHDSLRGIRKWLETFA